MHENNFDDSAVIDRLNNIARLIEIQIRMTAVVSRQASVQKDDAILTLIDDI